MPTLQLRFPGGRYHATPWGHHVNEGLIEWPPSPWRLLRAFTACGFSTLGWTEVPPLARQLLSKLAGALPSYHLPEASAAHSRHFMPVGSLDKGREKTTLVFDTWADVGDGLLLIDWPCQLDDEEALLLDQLVRSIGYLGRSESWVEAEVLPTEPRDPGTFNTVPCDETAKPNRHSEQVSLMAAIPPESYRQWHHQQELSALAPYPLPPGSKKPSAKLVKDREKAVAPYPPDLISCLTKETVWWKAHGWSQPPGSQRVLYWRPGEALQVGIPAAPRRANAKPVSMMLLSLSTCSGNLSSLPPVTRTLPQAELIHRAMISQLGNGEKTDCPELTGKDIEGERLRDNHGHAHSIPLDLDGDGRLDHILVYARDGLRDQAQQAIRRVRQTWAKGVEDALQVAVVGCGDLDLLRRLPHPLDRQIEAILGPPEGARIWESATPFVLPRTLDRRKTRSIAGQVNAELSSRGLPAAESVTVDPDRSRELRHHIRRRSRGGIPPRLDTGYGLRLVFSSDMQGPLTLGYASHYGLGLFRACES